VTEVLEKPKGSLGGRALLVSSATMLSRVLGLVREQVFAHLFGATMYADVFVAAFRIPNLLRDLFAEGVLSAAFVPTFTERLRTQGAQDAIRLANVVIGAVLVVVGAITAVGLVTAPWIVDLLVPGYAAVPGKSELTVLCTRIMLPFLPLVSLAAVAMGQLNSQERFGAPAIASALFNLAAIVGGLILSFAGAREANAAIGWSLFTLAGGAAQLAIQLPALFRTGFRFRPRIDWKEPGLRRIAHLMAPATFGLAATQVNIFVNTGFASDVKGANSWLSYAFRLMQLPIGVFGVAIATIATTRLATRAAERDMAGLRATFAEGLRLVAFLTVPCIAGLLALREPIVQLIFERGRFTHADTEATAAALTMYAIGLYCYSAVKVAAPAFYALDRTRVPVVGSIAAVAVNVTVSASLFPVLSYRGLALGTALGAVANFAILLASFGALAGDPGVRQILAHLVRVGVAAAICGVTAYFVHAPLAGALGVVGVGARIGAVLPAIAAGALAYTIACRLLDIRELGEVVRLVRRRRSSDTMRP
jgi:putative peptidoglycan lipid II flippase